MPGLVFLKLGGSLITHKDKVHSARLYMLNQACEQIARALADDPSLRLVIGHGSGSFGHVPATRYRTRQGVATTEEWRGFVEVWQAARALNIIVMKALHKFGVPALAFPPDAQAIAVDGKLAAWDVTLIRTALAGTGDIIPDPATNTLHIRLDALPAPRHTAAINELCQALNDTNTTYPGTNLTLRYSTKPPPRPHTNS